MLTNNLKPHNVQITSNLKVAFKSACQKYQLALEAERSKKEKQAVEDKKAIILSEIEDVKSQITLLTKTSVVLEKEFVLCAEQAEKENDILCGEQMNALKRKSEQKKEDVAKLEGALSLLEEKKKKLNWRSLILKVCVMLMFLRYFIEILQVSTFACFTICLVLKVYIVS